MKTVLIADDDVLTTTVITQALSRGITTFSWRAMEKSAWRRH